MQHHQTRSYEPVRAYSTPPRYTPRNEPTWWLKNTTPNSIAMWRVPKNSATSPDVNGTVDSHSRPIDAPKSRTVVGDSGSTSSSRIARPRATYRPASRFFLLARPPH